MLKVEKKYCGKWVAVKNEKIVESSKTFDGITRKKEARRDKKSLYLFAVPNGPRIGGYRCS